MILTSLHRGVTGEPLDDGDEPGEPSETHRGDFVHLKNARLMTGNGVTQGIGMLWRIRVSEVSGWMIGSTRM